MMDKKSEKPLIKSARENTLQGWTDIIAGNVRTPVYPGDCQHTKRHDGSQHCSDISWPNYVKQCRHHEPLFGSPDKSCNHAEETHFTYLDEMDEEDQRAYQRVADFMGAAGKAALDKLLDVVFERGMDREADECGHKYER